MLFHHHDYRSYLKEVLVERCQANPAYSLRLFAGELGLSPSALSEVLNGKKNLSFDRGSDIGKRLGLALEEREYFGLLVRFSTSKNPEVKKEIFEALVRTSRKTENVDLSIDAFALISDWYHIPILMLTEIAGFELTPGNVAKKLQISEREAEVAIERLLRLELLEKVPGVGYKRVPQSGLFKSATADKGLQKFHKQMLDKAIQAIETQNNDEKFIGTQTIAIHPSQMEKAKKRMKNFLKEMVELLDTKTKKTEVYHLSVQFFNLTGDKK